MRTVTLDVRTREEENRRVLAAFSGQGQGEFISFGSPALGIAPAADRGGAGRPARSGLTARDV